jgi:hypothetical protein
MRILDATNSNTNSPLELSSEIALRMHGEGALSID